MRKFNFLNESFILLLTPYKPVKELGYLPDYEIDEKGKMGDTLLEYKRSEPMESVRKVKRYRQ
jgi:hypothetical protein